MSKFKTIDTFGQNPLTERKHPLLFETVLDTIFPYLTFDEVKDSRLVCKTWNEIGIRILGRKKLKPINFADIKYEDFAFLREEFQNSTVPSPKIKLFQGFQLTWEEVVVMAYHNFMPAFQPSQLVISGSDIFPNANLTNILRSILTTLTDLNLEIKWTVISTNDFAILDDLANLGMTLKKLRLNIFKNEPDEYKIWDQQLTLKQSQTFCQNLGALLQSQCPFLHELELKFRCELTEKGNLEVIQLSPFPHLNTLNLSIEIWSRKNDDFHFFAPFDIIEIFPTLLHLQIFDGLLVLFLDKCIAGSKGHPLMMLTIFDKSFTELKEFENGFFNKLFNCFPNIEDFECQVAINNGGSEFPWVESLKDITLTAYYDLPPTIEILHLKNLENVHCIIFETEEELDITREQEIGNFIEGLKEHHLQLPNLKALRYTIEDDEGSLSSEELNRIQEALPPSFWSILEFD